MWIAISAVILAFIVGCVLVVRDEILKECHTESEREKREREEREAHKPEGLRHLKRFESQKQDYKDNRVQLARKVLAWYMINNKWK